MVNPDDEFGIGADLLGPYSDPNSLAASLFQTRTPLLARIDVGSPPTQSAFSSPSPGGPPGPDPMLMHQAMTAFGETRGVYPQMAPGRSGIYNPASYDPDSAAQLQLARAWMARVRLVNPKVNESAPIAPNPIEYRAWQNAMAATTAAKDIKLPDGVTHFYLRQGPTPAKAPTWAKGTPIKTFGPFINAGGGDVAGGPDMYIDFFGGK